MLKALEQHLTEGWRCEAAAARSDRDGSVVLGCESVPVVFAELNNLCVSRFEMAGDDRFQTWKDVRSA